MTHRVDISWKTLIFLALFLLSLWIIYHILDLILILFVAIIFMSALSPVVGQLIARKIPKSLSIALVYALILITLGLLLTISFTPVIEQTSNLISALPSTLENLLRNGNIDPSVIRAQLPDLSKNLLTVSKAIFDNFIAIVLILVLTFYLLLERENLEKRFASLFVGKEERVRRLLEDIEEKLGAWLRGQLSLSLIIGMASYIGLLILQIPYALPLAIWAGLLEVIPVIGPIISAIPAVLIGLTISPVLGGGLAAMYFVIQQLESHVVVPQVMKKAVGLNPLVVILAIAVGGRLLGVGGTLLAVPIVVVGQIIVLDILLERKS